MPRCLHWKQIWLRRERERRSRSLRVFLERERAFHPAFRGKLCFSRLSILHRQTERHALFAEEKAFCGANTQAGKAREVENSPP